jgi:surface antigen
MVAMVRAASMLASLLPLLALGGCLGFGGSLSTPASLAPSDPAVGALGDGLVGRIPGLKLNAAERSRALEAEFQALQFTAAGQPVTWTEGGVEGSVVPTQLYRVGSQDCRAFSHTVKANGRATAGQGTACRGEGGTWKVV